MRNTILVLAAPALFLAACSDTSSDPAPATATPPPVVAPPPPAPLYKDRVVALRYSLRHFGTPADLPATSPSITVEYEAVEATANGGHRRTQKRVEYVVQNVSTTEQQVTMLPLRTYANAIKPRVTVTITVPQLPAQGAGRGYVVESYVVVDGAAYSAARYNANQPGFTAVSTSQAVEIEH